MHYLKHICYLCINIRIIYKKVFKKYDMKITTFTTRNNYIIKAMSKPSIPKGTRDFSPIEMVKRNYIFSTIRNTFERFGFLPIETPAMENLSTLTGKYGDEGDQLIFKILNNGDFLKKADKASYLENNYKKYAFSISKKALRYDLTVPFARFVVMNQHQLAFPFRRYQIQPVWRGDRPGKGRYQEFYQCDVDIIGTESLLCEVELIQIFDEVLSNLGLPDFSIKFNNRKILAGIAQVAGIEEKLVDMTVAIDKLDKIGIDKVKDELLQRGISEEAINVINPIFSLSGSNEEKLQLIENILKGNEVGEQGITELKSVLEIVNNLGLRNAKLELDITLARGLNYYTGAIFEVVVNGINIGSVCGGGRYDDLTGIFGMKGMSGVGISFGAARIYDVMEELDLFPKESTATTKILFINFGDDEALHCMKIIQDIRSSDINAEIYPTIGAKMKKQMKYAHDKNIPFVAMVGSNEMEKNIITVKNMETGNQEEYSIEELVAMLRG